MSAPREPTAEAPDPRPGWAAPALLVLAVAVLVHARSLANGWVPWDDDVNFLDNPHYRGLAPGNLAWMFGGFHVGHYMPLTWLSCAVDHALWGMDPRGYHLTNALLHGGAAALLVGVIARLLGAGGAGEGASGRAVRWSAAAGALFFALHPLRVESVAWATERRDVLSGLLVVATLLAWLRYRQGGGARSYAAAVLLFALSLLAKVAGMTLPLVLVVLELWPLGGLRSGARRARTLRELAPFFVLAAGGALLGILGQARSTDVLAGLDGYPPSLRVALALHSLAFYLWKTVVPVGLSPFYELAPGARASDARFVVAALAVVALTAALALRARSSIAARAGLAAWAAFAALVLPVSGLTQSGHQLAADRYAYLPGLAAGALFAAGVLAAARGGRPALARFGAPAVLLVLAALTWKQIGVWRDGLTLFGRVVAVEPDSRLGNHRLGVELHRAGRYAEALEHYDRAVAQPDASDSIWYDRALTLLALGDVPEGLQSLEGALGRDPRNPAVWRVIEDVLVRTGRVEMAIDRFRHAVGADPGFQGGFLALSRLHQSAGELDEALAAAEAALALDGDAAAAHHRAARVLQARGAPDEAVWQMRAAIRARPGDADLEAGLASALAAAGRPREAREAWERALALDPAHGPSREALGLPPAPGGPSRQ